MLALVAALLAVLAVTGMGALAQSAPASHLRLLDADIDEVAPVLGQTADRQVRLWIEVEEAPRCATATTYGFVMDADQDPATGTAAGGLGVESSMVFSCDEATGGWSSALGDVTVEGNTLAVEAWLGILPSVEFDWIAFAREGDELVRVPMGSFASLERASW